MSVVLEPSTWYEATVVCRTETCERYEVETPIPELYSNADSNPRVVCYPCNGSSEVIAATKLDPQPEMA